MTNADYRQPIGHSMHPDDNGNYLIVGKVAHVSLARTLGANPAADDVSVLIDRKVVDHYRSPKSARLWKQALADRNELRRRIRQLEARLRGDPDAGDMPTVWTAPDGTLYDLSRAWVDRDGQIWTCVGWFAGMGGRLASLCDEPTPAMHAAGFELTALPLTHVIATVGPLVRATTGDTES